MKNYIWFLLGCGGEVLSYHFVIIQCLQVRTNKYLKIEFSAQSVAIQPDLDGSGKDGKQTSRVTKTNIWQLHISISVTGTNITHLW